MPDAGCLAKPDGCWICEISDHKWCELEFVVQGLGVMFFSGAGHSRNVNEAVMVRVGKAPMPRMASAEKLRHSAPPPMLNP